VFLLGALAGFMVESLKICGEAGLYRDVTLKTPLEALSGASLK
jgi:hypothetical protein